MAEIELLKINIEILKKLTLWPRDNDDSKKRTLKDILFLIFLTPMNFGVIAELIQELRGKRDDLNTFLSALVTTMCCITMFTFTVICYFQRSRLTALPIKLQELGHYGVPSDLVETEEKCRFYTIILRNYIFVSAFFYTILPFADYKKCKAKQEKSVYTKHIPCGFSPLWFPFSYQHTPLYEIVLFYTLCNAYAYCLIVSQFFLLCSCIILHILSHMRNLKKKLHEAVSAPILREKNLKNCFEYHEAIFEFGTYLDETFTAFSFALITLAAFIFGILEFQIITSETVFETTRYIAHMGGWVFTLLMLNNSAQILSNESISVASELFEMDILNLPISLQKDILFMIMRSQKPITLSTGPIGKLGLETYLSVMKTAYTYFTLLANLK